MSLSSFVLGELIQTSPTPRRTWPAMSLRSSAVQIIEPPPMSMTSNPPFFSLRVRSVRAISVVYRP